MKSTFTQLGAATIALLMLSTGVAAASEITGTLSSSGDTASAGPTTGTIGGSVSGPAAVSSGGGGGGGGGNGPPVGLLGGGGSGGGAVLGASTGPNSDYSVVFPAGEVAPPSGGTSGGVVSVTSYAPSKAALTGTSAMVPDAAPAVVSVDAPAPTPVAVVTTPTEDPGQLASAMSALAAGDVATWVWLLLVLALIVAAGTYLYSRYLPESTAREYY